MPAVRRSPLAVALAFAFAFGCLAPAVAQAAPVQCGQVLTESTVLSGNLIDCPGTALVAGAVGITIDLGGHTINARTPFGTPPGVDVSGHDGVRVVNGTIVGYDCGVALVGDDGIAQGITMRSVQPGICVLGDGNQVVGNQVRGSVGGVEILGGHGTVIRGNDLGFAQVRGFLIDEPGDLRGTRVVDNRNADTIEFGPAAGVVVSDNLVVGGTVTMWEGDSTTVIARNQVDGQGILVYNSRISTAEGGVRVANNRVTGGFGGITSDRAFAPGLDPAVWADRITGNLVQDSHVGIALNGSPSLLRDNILGQTTPTTGGPGGNRVGIRVVDSAGALLLRNRLHGNLGDGVRVDDAAGGVVLRDNVAAHNVGDGFDIRDHGTDLRGNTAVNNSSWGILAVGGVTGARNQAGGNLLGQCRPAQLC